MKKTLLPCLLCSLVMAGGPLGAQDTASGGEVQNSWQIPDRVFELGVDVDAGFGNNLIKFEDVFNFRKTLLVDLSALSPGELFLTENAAASVFVNLNLGKRWRFGLFAGVQLDAYQSGPEEFTELLRRGNARTKSMKVGMTGGAGLFADAGVKVENIRDRLRLTVKPAAYIPLIYIPPPDMSVDINMTDTGLTLKGLADINIYSPFSIEHLTEEGQTVDISAVTIDPLALGFDLTLGGSYRLLPSLDLGLNIANIPLYPARLQYEMHQGLKMDGDWTDMYGTLTSGNFDIPELETDQSYRDNASFMAFRPLRFDVFAEYRPVEIDLFVFRPHIGFSVLTVFGYDTACFNAGLDGQINIANIFGLSLGTEYRERLWKQSLGIRLNFRALELSAEASLRGPDLMSSFKGRGFGVVVGIRLGF
jgi:hypothetical protein